MVVPQPSVARYCAIVVVKPPEFEKMAIEPLSSDFLGVVAAERAADADAIPGIRDAEAVSAENIDAVRLADGTNFARVMHRDFLGDHHDFLQRRIDADQLRHPVAHAGRRQIDDAGIERQTVIETLADIVIDRNFANRR